MSSFDDFCSESLGDSGDIIGREAFTIPGIDGDFEGILNEFTAARDIDLGGKVGTYTATLLCELGIFEDLAGPLERTLEGKRVVIGGLTFKIDRVAIDSTSATLGLNGMSK